MRPLFGDLAHLAGRVPTPAGWLDVDLTPAGGSITVPDGIEVALEFDDADLAPANLAPGRHAIS